MSNYPLYMQAMAPSQRIDELQSWYVFNLWNRSTLSEKQLQWAKEVLINEMGETSATAWIEQVTNHYEAMRVRV